MAQVQDATPVERDAIKLDAQPTPVTRRPLWALIIGISQYKHSAWNLRYADADADALYDLLVDPHCGGYPPEQICKLTNAQATRDAIWRELHGFLRKPARDDFVVVFIACHGGPDPERTEDLYLFPHDTIPPSDTDPNSIATTAIRMEDLERALRKRNLRSDRVVLLIDACHAGGFASTPGSTQRSGPSSRSTVDASDAMNRFFRNMAAARGGMATLTAAEQGEAAWEGQGWGSGHGVFTYYLLEGLQGAAARPEDGIVTVGDLFEYVASKVPADPIINRRQHPHATLTADTRPWPMAVVSDLIADERHRLGRALSVIGQRLGDRGRFEHAIAEHTVAIGQARQLGRGAPRAHYEIGRCWLAAGDLDRAAAALRDAEEHAREERASGREVSGELLADVRFWAWAIAFQRPDLGVQVAEQRFMASHPSDPRLPIVQEASALRSRRRRALLIGAGGSGPANDVAAMRELLLDSAYAEDEIATRCDPDATTRVAILAALGELRASCEAGDEVLIFFAGRSVRAARSGDQARSIVWLCPSDFVESLPSSAITAQELHEALIALPAEHVVVIMDTCYGGGLIRQARSSQRYTLWSGTDDDEIGDEIALDGGVRGAFTVELIAALRGTTQTTGSIGDVVDTVAAALRPRQTSVFVGDQAMVLSACMRRSLRTVTTLMYAQRVFFGAASRDDLERLASELTLETRLALPDLGIELARACLDARMHETAASLFSDTATGRGDLAAAHLGAAIAHAHLGDYPHAEQCFHEAAVAWSGSASLDPVHDALVRLQRARTRHALLVGVTRSTEDGPALAPGARRDVEGMQVALQQVFGDSIVIEQLVDDQATREAVLDRFRALVADCAEAPCLFFFAGPGTPYGEVGLQTFEPDRRGTGRILLSELANLAGRAAKNLICVFDAGWVPCADLPWIAPNNHRCDVAPRGGVGTAEWVAPARARAAAPPRANPVGHRDISAPGGEFFDGEFVARRARRALAVAHLGFGGVTICSASILARMCPDDGEPGEAVVEAELLSPVEPRGRAVHGVLSHALIGALLSLGPGPQCSFSNLQTWMRRLRWLQPVFIGSASTERFMSNVVLEDEFERVVRRASLDRALFDAIELLETRRVRLERMEDGDRKRSLVRDNYRELGIAYRSAGELDRAIAALQRALASDGMDDPDIRAYLGRALVEEGHNLDSAVSHLQEAIALRPGAGSPPHVHYYYGRALRERLENQDSERLERAWRSYLAQGAPLGHRDEIESYLSQSSRGNLDPEHDRSDGPLRSSGTRRRRGSAPQ